jgi:hypothetical protein
MRLVSALVLALLAASASAQPAQPVLFPGESGETLLASIRTEYRPSALTGDNDDLYARVDSTTVDGQLGVVGVYTGLFVPFDCNPSCDPSQDVGNGFSPTGETINQEHTYPRSRLGGSSRVTSESDLHNLFPTQVGVNSDRGSLPFADVPDDQATRWYRGAPPYSQTSPPASDIDEYSEIGGGAFEPREDHKGNVARAMFYVQAVYPDQADANWFEPQTETLYDWHDADPVDQAELDRTYRIAAFQSDTPNPFVLDSTLVRRAYFPEIAVASEPGASRPLVLRVVGTNPFRDRARLTLELPVAGVVRAEAFDALGRRLAVLWDGPAPAGPLALALDGTALAPGAYVVRVVSEGAVAARVVVRAR